jgi:hypothetical protein
MPTSTLKEVLNGFGHPNIQATHHATIEFTKETQLSKSGDCILVVGLDRSLVDLSPEFKDVLRKPRAKLVVTVEVGRLSDKIQGQGARLLPLDNPVEMVMRKSDFISDRTLAICADKAAKDINRELVEKLKNPLQKAKIVLTVHG